MNEENNLQTELIESYLEGKLSPEEEQSFEKRLAAEASLAEQVALQRKAVANIKSAGRATLLRELREEDARMPAYRPEAKVVSLGGDSGRQKMLYWAVAAGLLLLLIPFIVMFNQKQESQQLFSEYFSPYQDQHAEGLPEQARNLYEGKNYAQALPVLERMLESESSKAAVLFYKGNSHLALEHVPEAIASFEAVLALPPNNYSEEAKWYLALSYVKDNQQKKAKQLLREITAQPGHPYYNEAEELLEEL